MALTTPAQLPPLSTQTRLLVVAPHPDDETLAAGILIQQVCAAGGTVIVLLLTDGDNNPWPQRWLERRLRIGALERQSWGQRRRAEMAQALQRLGVPASALHRLGWPDLGVTAALWPTPQAAVTRLREQMMSFQPDLVVAPGLGDRHPDHGSAHVVVQLALATLATQPTLLTYVVHGRRVAETLVDVDGSSEQQAHKQSALAAHASQMALAGRRLRQLADRPERFGVSPAAVAPGLLLPWQPSAWLRPWLRLQLVGAQTSHCWRWNRAPLQRDDSGCYHLQWSASLGSTPRFARLTLALPLPWIFDHWGWCEVS
ncbi:MAG: PIG-L deacetylase family protein [Rhodanobacter sp.]